MNISNQIENYLRDLFTVLSEWATFALDLRLKTDGLTANINHFQETIFEGKWLKFLN